MKVLLLSPYPHLLMGVFGRDEVVACVAPPSEWPEADFIVSYGYRHIIREPMISRYAGRLINIHISYLPWNRGADPNLWSWYDNTPRGVTIHDIDGGIDTGPIIAQRLMGFDPYKNHTLATTYAMLHRQAQAMLSRIWPITPNTPRLPQKGQGSFHRSKDKDAWFPKLPLGYDTPVQEVIALGKTG